MSKDVWWLFDHYVLVINNKMRAQQLKQASTNEIMGAIIAKFLIENQQSILDEYKELSAKQIERVLPKLGFGPSDISAIGFDRTIRAEREAASKEAGALRTATESEQSPAASDAERPWSYKCRDDRAIERLSRGNKILRKFAP